MALIQAFNPSSGGSGQELLFNTITEVLTTAFEFPLDPATIVLTGTTIVGVILVNYQGQALTLNYGDGAGDYSYTSATKTITLRFDDDPANYANGEIVVQVTYSYYA